MNLQLAKDEYTTALGRGKKEYKELLAAGKNPHPAVLDDILAGHNHDIVQDIGLVEIPSERIVGTRSAGRITAFTPSFRPLLDPESEFALKWATLCCAHMDETGIRDPIVCYEYLGNFYVQEGNKRVSVLRHFDAPRIPGLVKRVMPPVSDDPRIRAYYEFTEFYNSARIYAVQFRHPGDYARLLAFLGKNLEDPWDEQERRTFRAYFQYFTEAFQTLNVQNQDILPEEALLLWLQVNPYGDLGRLSAAQLRKSLAALWSDVVTSTQHSEVRLETDEVSKTMPSALSRLISPAPDHVNVAFVHQMEPRTSAWVLGHEEGREYVEKAVGSWVTCRSYFNANTPEEMDQKLQQAVEEGAQIIFTTSPRLSRVTLKMAVKHPKLLFFNCSVDLPYSSLRTYYGRIYEGKFITGAIAGAMAQDNRIGYVAANPIFGVPASINAFALGAQLTNPRAQIELRWSCCEGSPQADFFRDGIRVVSNREMPTQNQRYLEFCNYGTYLLDDRGGLIPLASPVWVWGKFYEKIIRGYLSGIKKGGKMEPKAVNYWLGMDSGVIGLELSDRLPAGLAAMAKYLRSGIENRLIDPFARRIVAQDGSVKNEGTATFTPEQLLHMDWLCDNVVGAIPSFSEILPMSQPIVRELGIYRDSIPALKEKDV